MTYSDLGFFWRVGVAALLVGAYVHVERYNRARMAALEARIMALDQHCDDVKELFVLDHNAK